MSNIVVCIQVYEGGSEQPAIHGVVRYLAQFFNHVENLASLLVAAENSDGECPFVVTSQCVSSHMW